MQAGEPVVETADVMWKLDYRRDGLPSQRWVMYANTEITDGSILLGRFDVDTSKTPHWITFEFEGGPPRCGIVKLEGDRLTIALPPRRWVFEEKMHLVGKRPRSFESTRENRVAVYTLKRRPIQ